MSLYEVVSLACQVCDIYVNVAVQNMNHITVRGDNNAVCDVDV
jgi:hypothetical protein